MQGESRQCFVEVAPDRAAATLLHIIEQLILPGTILLTDQCAAYRNLQQLQGGTVKHDSIYFVDPNDPSIHTNTIEWLWSYGKQSHPSRPISLSGCIGESSLTTLFPINSTQFAHITLSRLMISTLKFNSMAEFVIEI